MALLWRACYSKCMTAAIAASRTTAYRVDYRYRSAGRSVRDWTRVRATDAADARAQAAYQIPGIYVVRATEGA